VCQFDGALAGHRDPDCTALKVRSVSFTEASWNRTQLAEGDATACTKKSS
jgi:hypothetical protein